MIINKSLSDFRAIQGDVDKVTTISSEILFFQPFITINPNQVRL
ncbi:hypothetical protein DsansV1_C10g0103981 [Dioscorea sansibarensis]